MVASAEIYTEEATGLTQVKLTNVAGAQVLAYTFGAHVTSWVNSAGNELLFMSEKAVLDGKKAIRGGIPICWPQFGAGPAGPYSLPASHGFARITEWACVASTDGASSKVVFTLSESPTTLAIYPHRFTVEYTVTLTATGELGTSLQVSNDGDNAMPFQVCQHTPVSFSHLLCQPSPTSR
eukprot:SAG31_NODE_7268_length_1737_cov_4.735043_3_plen_180_part_00